MAAVAASTAAIPHVLPMQRAMTECVSNRCEFLERKTKLNIFKQTKISGFGNKEKLDQAWEDEDEVLKMAFEEP